MKNIPHRHRSRCLQLFFGVIVGVMGVQIADAASEPAAHAISYTADANDNRHRTPSTNENGANHAPRRTMVRSDVAIILNLAGAYFSDSPMQLGHHDPQRNGITFQELEFSFAVHVDRYFKLQGYVSASEHGFELEEAFAQTTALPGGLSLRLGKFLQPFGAQNPVHFHDWDFLDMPLVMGKFFGDEGLVGTGVELSWQAPTPWDLTVYASGVHGEGARAFRGSDRRIESMRDFLYVGAIKNAWQLHEAWQLQWGVSGAWGRNNAAWDDLHFGTAMASLPQGGNTQIYGSDLTLSFRPNPQRSAHRLTLQTEVMHQRRTVGGIALQHTGFYTQLTWGFHPHWGVGARVEWMSHQAFDDLDPDWSAPRQRTSVQGTFSPTEYTRIRLQGNLDRPTWRPRPIASIMLGLQVSFERKDIQRQRSKI